MRLLVVFMFLLGLVSCGEKPPLCTEVSGSAIEITELSHWMEIEDYPINWPHDLKTIYAIPPNFTGVFFTSCGLELPSSDRSCSCSSHKTITGIIEFKNGVADGELKEWRKRSDTFRRTKEFKNGLEHGKETWYYTSRNWYGGLKKIRESTYDMGKLIDEKEFNN